MLSKAAAYVRYAAALRRFLRTTMTAEAAHRQIETQLASRDEAFLDLLKRAVYAHPASPYRALLAGADIAFDDVARMVGQDGVEGALDRLYDAGVYMTLDESKGREPVCRNGVELQVRDEDFDNPLLARHYEGRTSGSRGSASRVQIDFEHMTLEAGSLHAFLEAHGNFGRPLLIWRTAPPDTAGILNVFRYTKIGMRPERWFAQNGFGRSAEGPGAAMVIAVTLLASRLAGRPLPRPEFVPQEQAILVARWLAVKTARGTPAILECGSSSGVRVCIAAKEAGLDISGTDFRVGGEPFTQAKADAYTSVGGKGVNRYSMNELGNIGLACATPRELDDLHMLTSKIAITQKQRSVAANGASGVNVGGLLFTSLDITSPKIMINTESGDYGALEVRDCGCSLGAIGFRTHVTGLRSYDKLTSEGVTFTGSALYELVESVLPARFGGSSTDYQLVEKEDGGLVKVGVVVAPRVGAIDDAAVIATVVQTLAALPKGGRLMTEQWLRGDTLRVLRREPYTTSSAKILPLHLIRTNGAK